MTTTSQGAFPPPQRHATPRPEPTAPAPQPVDETLSADALLSNIREGHAYRPRPHTGLRGAIYNLTNGRVNLGPSPAERHTLDLIETIQTPLNSTHPLHITIWNQKGGVGKTTTTTNLGITLAMNRTDKVLALDTNPDGGSLAVRVPQTTTRSIIDLRDALSSRHVSPTEFDRFVNHAAHRLDTIVMPPGKKSDVEAALSGDDYRMIAKNLAERYPYKFVLTDCGTNLSDSVMKGIMPLTDQLVIVTTTVKDEAAVTAGGLDALARSGHADLVKNAITVIVNKAPKDPDLEVQREIEATAREIKAWFGEHTAEVVEMPYDPRLRIGGVVDPDQVGAATRRAQLGLAAAVVRRLAQD